MTILRTGLVSLSLIAFMPTSVCATACDTWDGLRQEQERPVANMPVPLEYFKLSSKLHFTDSPMGAEGVGEGVGWTQNGWDLRLSRNNNVYAFNVSSDGKSGKITFNIPKKYNEFLVDTQETAHRRDRMGPNIYIEWRLKGEVRLDGVFAVAARKAKAELIFQGLGNGCRSVEDFYAWTLIVKGDGVGFTLIGRFKTARGK